MADEPSDARGPAGFGKGVNDYLNFFVFLADAKAAGFLAAGLTVGAAIAKVHPANPCGTVARWLGLTAIGASVGFSAFVVFPRLPSGRRGLVFWEDIRTYRDHDDYVQRVATLTAADVEKEYAAQNYFMSDVLHRKHKWARVAIGLFLVGAAAGFISYLMK